MWALNVLVVSLIYVQGCWCGRVFPRQILPDGSIFHQGGPMNGPYHPHFGPGGDPTKQQQNNQQSMMSSGSCVPSLSDCPCPNHAFLTPSGCFFCHCLGYQEPGQLVPTSSVTESTTNQPNGNSPTPPIPKTVSPVTIATAAKVTTAPSTSQCKSAARLCQMNCPGGYLVDPDDCMFCVCKSKLNTITGR